MHYKTKYLSFIFFSLFALSHFSVYAQTKRQLQLEERRRELQQEIRQITNLLFAGKREEKSVVSVVEDLNYKISVRKNLMRITNQQANLLTREINSNQSEISKRRDRLKVLKDDYGNMIVKSYKNRANQNKLMFLLSSSNFQQAYRRLQYIKQYADYQKEQAIIIKEETEKLKQLNQDLLVQKKEKQKLVAENKAAKSILDKELKAQETLINSIQKNLSKFTAQIKLKQKESEKLPKYNDW